MKLMLCPYSKGDPALAADAFATGKCSKCGFSNRWKKLRAALLQSGRRPSKLRTGRESGGNTAAAWRALGFHETCRVGYIRIGSSGQAC